MTHPHLAPSHAGLEFILGRIIQDFMRYMKQTGLSTPASCWILVRRN